MRALARTSCFLAMSVAVRAAADPFYRVGVVVGAERRQFSSLTDSDTMTGTDIGLPTGTSSSSNPAPTPFLSFYGSSTDLSTCETTVFRWSYSGPTDVDMTLLVTNVDVPQEDAPSSDGITHSQFTRREEMTTVISSYKDTTYYTEFLSITLDPAVKTYIWSPVNVPEGWYRLQSNISSSSFNSVAFHVKAGIDTSCVLPPAPSSTPSSSSSETPSPTSAPGETGTPTPVPVGKGSNVGAIAGGVVGGVVGLALILLLLLFLRRRSRRSHLEPGGLPPKSRFLGAWGNLGSFESKSSRTPGGSAGNARPDHTRDDSMGAPMILSQSSSPAATRLGHGDGSDESVPYHEKGFAGRTMSVDSQSPFSDIPIAVYDASGGGSRPTRHSSLSSTYNFAVSRRSTSQTFPESVHNSIASSFPSGFGSYVIPPSPTLVNTSSTAFFPSPTPASPETTTPHPRKTPRKPVPSYNPNDPAMTGAENSRSSILIGRDADETPSRPTIRHNDSANSLHKQLHVLIPDMPLPQKD